MHAKYPYIVRRNCCVNHYVSCGKCPIIVGIHFFTRKILRRPFTFVLEVSNYSRGIFFRKVRSSYSLLSTYSEEIFFCKKKVSRKPLSFVPQMSNISRRSFKIFSKTPPQTGKQMSIYSERKRR